MFYTKEEIEFASIKDFYEKVEEIDAYKVTAIPWRLKELMENTSDTAEKLLLEYEMEAFHYVLRDGGAKGYTSSPENDGVTVWEYPDIKKVSKEALQYYYTRISQTRNNSLQLRYLQIIVSAGDKTLTPLCFNPLIDGLITEIKKFRAFEEIASGAHNLRVLIKNAFILAKRAKYKLSEISELCYAFFERGYPVSGKYRLVELIINNRKCYTKEVLDSCYQACIDLSLITPYCDDLSAMERLCAVGIKLAKIVGHPFKEWHEKLGIAYEKEMNKRMLDDKHNMMPMHWCEKAIEQFQQAGMPIRVKDLYVQYAAIRKNFKLDSYRTEFDREAMTEWYDWLDHQAKYLIMHNGTEALLHYLSYGNDIFPNITWLKEYAERKEDSFLDTISISKADTNKNFSKKVITDEDHNWHRIYDSYSYYSDFHVLPFLRRIFFYGFLKQKICYNTIIEHLQHKTWIGCTLVSKDTGGNEIRYNWLSLIAPALFNFHKEFEAFLFSDANRINLVLSIDSLVLKFEGLIRDFARLLALPTTIMVKGYMREMYIEELLDLKEMKEYFDENDMLLFKYVFISKNGLNLRNNIAHSFLHFNQYRIEYMLLMIMALLRLGKYTVDTTGQTV